MRRRGWIALGAGAVAALVVTVTAVAIWPKPGPAPSHAPFSTPSAADAETPVCGFPGTLISQITADRPNDAEAFWPSGWDLTEVDGDVAGIAATADGVVIAERGDDDETRFARYDRSGTYLGTSSPTRGGGIVADDGRIWTIDSEDGRRVLAVSSRDGVRQADYEVPHSGETTGGSDDLHDVTWVADVSGSPALLVSEGEHTVHVFREDGAYVGVRDDLPGSLFDAVGRSAVAGTSSVPGDDGVTSLQVADAATGALLFQAPFHTDEDEPSETPSVLRFVGLVPGPDGDGFLVASAIGIEWLDSAGVRKGYWPTGAAGLDLWERGGIAERDGTYWILTPAEDGDRILTLDAGEMKAALAIPSDFTASNESTLARLGIGIGAVTHQEFNHFDAGDPPAVLLRAEQGWGERPGQSDEPLEARYTVRGDPLLADPVAQEERTVDVPFGGGETPLELPETRPGAYEVTVSLVDRDTGDILSGTCLRYSVGAPDASLGLADLPPGADWGGPDPLRGTQLASDLGIGSYRIQLSFSSLVPDPTATPSPDEVDWSALPGSDFGDDDSPPDDPEAAGFAEITESAALAAREGVDIVVQVGNNGDGEKAALDAQTWGGWVGVIVDAFERHAPEVTLWSAWNEPNAVFSPADFADRVEIPFADAVHAANPTAEVLGGNTLEFAFDWWRDYVGTGVCAKIDAVAVHPYTGWNRSWEEEGYAAEGGGYDELRSVLGDECGRLPLWDTETGWTADGEAAYWAQGANIARKLLWYSNEGISGWTYFYSEGGWGENNLSWSLVQDGSYVKPGGLAFASVSRLIAGRDRGEVVETGIPFAYAMRFAGSTDLVAAWTDEMRIDAVVTVDGAADSLTVVDEYGASDTIDLDDGRAQVVLTGSPRFFRAPAGSRISIEPVEAFGDDVLASRPVEASSTHGDSDAQVVTSGTVNPYRPWRSGRLADGGLDENPSVEIPLATPTTLDRIAVASGSIACCEAGLRAYTVSIRDEAGEWHVVARQSDQFWERVAMFRFDPVVATAVRVEIPWTTIRGVRVLDVNYSGFAGGLPPPFMGLKTESDYIASIAAVSAWAPAG